MVLVGRILVGKVSHTTQKNGNVRIFFRTDDVTLPKGQAIDTVSSFRDELDSDADTVDIWIQGQFFNELTYDSKRVVTSNGIDFLSIQVQGDASLASKFTKNTIVSAVFH